MRRLLAACGLAGALTCSLWAAGAPSTAASWQLPRLHGIESISVEADVEIQPGLFERVDADYLKSLIEWQLDQHRIEVVKRSPSTPYLEIRIQAEPITGPVVLKGEDEDREIEGIFRGRVELVLKQQVTTLENPSHTFWNSTYERSAEHFAESRSELEGEIVRLTERVLLRFIRTFRRANPSPR